VGGIKMWKMF